MAGTVSGTYTTGLILSSNPTTITGTALVGNTAATGAAVLGAAGTTWTLTNLGTIAESGNGAGMGVAFAALGTIVNAGTIGGGGFGVSLAVGGTVVNAGSIAGLGASGVGIEFGPSASGGPVTNQSTGVIYGTGDGIYVRAGAGPGTIVNAGTIAAGGAAAFAGAVLFSGGVVSNASGATITGYRIGVTMSQAAGGTVTSTVINAGSIGGTVYDGVWMQSSGTVTNASGGVITGGYSTYGAGVYLQAGGSVTNQSGGTIGGLRGVYALNDAATVVNGGDIIGSGTTIGAAVAVAYGGVYLGAGGSVTNQSTGTISGYDGVNVKGAAGTVVNAGTIAGNSTYGSAAGVYLSAGGSVTNQAGGTISGFYGVKAVTVAATVVNAGTIAGVYTSDYINADGVFLAAGGSVTNQATGAIYGRNDGVSITGGRGTVVNLGTIHSRLNSGYGGQGVRLDQGGLIVNGGPGGTTSAAYINGYNGGIIFGPTGTDTLVNFGTVAGDEGFVGASLLTGTVINGASGVTGASIKSGYEENGVVIYGPGTVTNYGTIIGLAENGAGRAVYGVSVGGSGSVASFISNLGAAAVISGYVAVYAGQNATVTNSGTLLSTQAFGGIAPYNAVIFGGGTNRLIIDPGAVFIGDVFGSGPVSRTPYNGLGQNTIVLGTAHGIGTTTMELASGASAGTLSGLGTKYIGFSAITLDSSATWTLAGSNTLASGVTLYNSSLLIDSGTLTNAGIISGNAVKALVLTTGAQLTNQSGGTISGSHFGVTASGAATVVNAGLLSDAPATTTNSGIYFTAGGSVTNQSGGIISGRYGIFDKTGTLLLTNAGSIAGTVDGIKLGGGATITNQPGGTISGATDAILFASGVSNRLVDAPGAVFAGSVVAAGTTTMELASAASAGTIAGFGTSITNFTSLVFDSGAQWTVAGNGSASGLGTLAITGFTLNDTIDLTGFVAVSDTFANNILTLTSATSAKETLHIQGAFTSGRFQLINDQAGGTDIVICFAAGTMIDTPGGEVRVETLAAGDLVRTLHNGARPVKWIGKGKVLSTRGRRTAATPVIVCKDALGKDLPRADLRVTKAHSLYIDEVLIPVEFLVNHRSIVWDDRAQELEIYHVELDSHDVLIANGVAAESYRDDGNRWLFQNANPGWEAAPQEPYAPVLTGGPVVDAAWRRFLDLSGPRDLPPLTDNPGLHLVVDGKRIDPADRHGLSYVFCLPAGAESVHVASREVVPAEMGFARDPRSLGVALRRIVLKQGSRSEVLTAADARLADGFHAFEAAEDLRWTDGYAGLPIEMFALFDGPVDLVVTLAVTTTYPDHGEAGARAA